MIHNDIIDKICCSRFKISIKDLWVLLARSQVVAPSGWISDWLWRYRKAQGVSSLIGHCLSCGVSLGSSIHSRTTCSDACRTKAFRDRKLHGGSQLELEIDAARTALRGLESELESFRQWLSRNPSMQILPPDLLGIQNLPALPGRCGRGCFRGVGCSHTEGSACLFSGTRGGMDDE
jgi:hypothetical protein